MDSDAREKLYITHQRRFSLQEPSKLSYRNYRPNDVNIELLPRTNVRHSPHVQQTARSRKISTNSSRLAYISLTAIPEDGERTLSHDNKSNTSSDLIINDPAPDGGYGWVIVMASFLCNLTVDGICYTFGIFFNDFVNYFDSSKAITALAGSLLSGCYLTAGVFVSGLTNRYGCRPVTIAGSVISCCAFLLSTFAPNIYILLLTYGIIAGTGFGLIYLPAIVSVGYYFTTKRAFATGIAVCGSGFGAFLFAPLCQWLLMVFDWKNAIMILAGLTLNCVVFGALMRPLKVNIQKNTIINESEERNTEPGVHDSNMSIQIPEVTVSHPEVTITQPEVTIARPEVTITHPVDDDPKHESNNETFRKFAGQRTKSDCTGKPPKIEDILSQNDPQHVLHDRKLSCTIVVPPLTKRDVFYSGSTLNIMQSKTMLNDSFIFNNNTKLNEESVQQSGDNENLAVTKESKNNGISMNMLNLSILKVPAMALLSVSNIFGMMGYYIPFVYITQHVRKSVKDGDDFVSPARAALLLSAIGISNVSGRLFFGWLSDRISNRTIVGRIRITALTINNVCLLMSGIVTMVIPLLDNYWMVLSDVILFGFFISSYMSLTSIILVDLLGIETLSTTFGLISCFRGIASIIGPPIAGALYDLTQSFTFCFISAGALLIISSAISFMVMKYEK